MSRPLVQISHVNKSFGSLRLFKDISLSVNKGSVFALIGANGTGKSTLLQMLSGTVSPDKGKVVRSNQLSLQTLEQEILATNTVRSYLENPTFIELEKRMQECLEDPNRLDEWGELHDEYENRGGYQKIPVEKVLSGLCLDLAILEIPMTELSSGQRVRVALAKTLVENPDLLLLDEPTNHLDQEMIEWLENTLRQRKGATVIVSHNRKFLNKTCNRLIEIENGKLTIYGGNYDFYLEEKERLIAQQIHAFEEQKKERSALRKKIKAMSFSMKSAAKPKDQDRIAYNFRGENQQKSQKRSIDAMKKKLEEIEAHPLTHPRPKSISGLAFSEEPLNSSIAIELTKVQKSIGKKMLFTNLSRTIYKDERIVITGPNGSGKTTFMQCIAGHQSIDSGEIHFAKSVKIAYLDQEALLLPMNSTPIEHFKNHFHLSEEQLRKELHKSAIGGAELLKRPFSSLSVGQRKRLMLLAIILEKPNVLLLDEPTNHLDLMTIEALEKALISFKGAIIAVSHDKVFTEKIATELWYI